MVCLKIIKQTLMAKDPRKIAGFIQNIRKSKKYEHFGKKANRIFIIQQ